MKTLKKAKAVKEVPKKTPKKRKQARNGVVLVSPRVSSFASTLALNQFRDQYQQAMATIYSGLESLSATSRIIFTTNALDPVIETLDVHHLIRQVFARLGIHTYGDMVRRFPYQALAHNVALHAPFNSLGIEYEVAERFCKAIFQRSTFTTKLTEFCAYFGLDTTIYTL